MIDTSKYEGHTPAPWKAENQWHRNGIDENNLGQVQDYLLSWGVTLSEERLSDCRGNRIGHHVMHKADAQLIADAPLLLAEVKRLREENKVLAKYRDIVNKYDDALLADGDDDPRWSELYD